MNIFHNMVRSLMIIVIVLILKKEKKNLIKLHFLANIGNLIQE